MSIALRLAAGPALSVMNVDEQDRRLAARMNAARTGDRTAYENLVRESIPFIKMVVRRQGVPADFVDDVVQDTLLTVHRSRQCYDSARPFMAWLRTIAQRRASDFMRSQGRTSLREVHAPLAFENHPDPMGNPEEQAYQADRRSLIGMALAALPARQREALEQLALGGKSPTDAAAATGRTPGALKVNFHRALATLRAHVRDGLSTSVHRLADAEHSLVKFET